MNQPNMVPTGPLEYQLIEDYTYTWFNKSGHSHHSITIPAGVITDGASVPRFAWSIIRPDGLIRAAALIHDMLYVYGGDLPKGWHTSESSTQTFTKHQSDKLFRQIMREAGVSNFKVKIAYRMVRWFGKGSF